MQNKPELKYFYHSRLYFRFILLKKIDEQEGIILPVQSQDSELLLAMSITYIQNIVEEGLVKKVENEDATEILVITEKGKSQLQQDHIDYQLDLLALEQSLGDYYYKKIGILKEKNIKSVALYGASDTAQSFLNYLINNGINIACILDDDESKHTNNYFGFPVISTEEVSLYTFDAIIITTVKFQDEIKSRINQSFGSKYKVIPLFQE